MVGGIGPRLTVVIPCFNEEGSLEVVVREVAGQAAHFAAFEILVVDDGSTDGSPQIIERLTRELGVRAIRNSHNSGLGATVANGFGHASMEWVTYWPADGQVPAVGLQSLCEHAASADIVVGYRLTRPDYSAYRKLATTVYTAWVSAAFGLRLRDYNWVQFYKRRLWSGHRPVSRSVFFCAEFLVRAQDARPVMVETPVGYLPRASGRAKNGGLRAARLAAADILKFWGSRLIQGKVDALRPFVRSVR